MTLWRVVRWHFSAGDLLILAGLMLAAGVIALLNRLRPRLRLGSPCRTGGYPSGDGAGTN